MVADHRQIAADLIAERNQYGTHPSNAEKAKVHAMLHIGDQIAVLAAALEVKPLTVKRGDITVSGTYAEVHEALALMEGSRTTTPTTQRPIPRGESEQPEKP